MFVILENFNHEFCVEANSSHSSSVSGKFIFNVSGHNNIDEIPAAKIMIPYIPRGREWWITESIAINVDNTDPTRAAAEAIPNAVVRYGVRVR